MTSTIFSFRGAGRYLFGSGSLAELGRETAALGQHPLLVLDPALDGEGLKEKIIAAATSAGASCELFEDFQSEPEPDQAEAAAQLAKSSKCDLVIGVGGGSAMDLAKAASVLTTCGGNAVDYVGVDKVPGPGLPTIMVPTTAGTGAEVTWTAVFTRRKDHFKGGINSQHLYPTLALLDPELTLTVPPFVTAFTGMDALCHAIESYTSLKASPLSDMVSREAIGLIAENLPLVVANGKNLEAREKMLLGSLMAGLGLANAGVTAVHALSYPLGAIYGIPHGLANAVLLPYVLAYNWMGNPRKFAQVTRLMGEDTGGLSSKEAAKLSGQVVLDLMDEIGLPTCLSELDPNIKEEGLDELSQKAMGLQRVLDNNPRTISEHDAADIYQEAY